MMTEKVFQDFNGVPLQIGDTVNFISPGYRSLSRGTIIAFTAQKVRLTYLRTWTGGTGGQNLELLQTSDQLIKYKND